MRAGLVVLMVRRRVPHQASQPGSSALASFGVPAAIVALLQPPPGSRSGSFGHKITSCRAASRIAAPSRSARISAAPCSSQDATKVNGPSAVAGKPTSRHPSCGRYRCPRPAVGPGVQHPHRHRTAGARRSSPRGGHRHTSRPAAAHRRRLQPSLVPVPGEGISRTRPRVSSSLCCRV